MRPQDLVQVQQTVTATLAALRGDFDTEIKTLRAATAEWDKRRNVDEAEKAIAAEKTNLASAATAVEYAAKEHETRLQKMQDALVVRESAATERERALAQRETDLAHAQNALDTDRAAFTANAASMNADLQAKLAAAQELLDQLAGREAAIGQRESKVKQALAQVGTLVQ
jgi:chromosome segregation ATPase